MVAPATIVSGVATLGGNERRQGARWGHRCAGGSGGWIGGDLGARDRSTRDRRLGRGSQPSHCQPCFGCHPCQFRVRRLSRCNSPARQRDRMVVPLRRLGRWVPGGGGGVRATHIGVRLEFLWWDLGFVAQRLVGVPRVSCWCPGVAPRGVSRRASSIRKVAAVRSNGRDPDRGVDHFWRVHPGRDEDGEQRHGAGQSDWASIGGRHLDCGPGGPTALVGHLGGGGGSTTRATAESAWRRAATTEVDRVCGDPQRRCHRRIENRNLRPCVSCLAR